MRKDNRWCKICNPKNRTIYFHEDKESGAIWLFCNKCDRGYSLANYSRMSGVPMEDILKDATIEEASPNEVNALSWPSKFIPMSDPRAIKGINYVKSRGLSLDGDFYYDMDNEGIVFPYYFGNTFCGAQVRFIEPRINEDGSEWKITTLPGTRLGLLFYNWNQTNFINNIRGVIVTEGAFNALAIQQSLNKKYGGISSNPWRAIACSGATATKHHQDELKALVDRGIKVIIAPDTDEAGIHMANKFKESGSASHIAFTGDTEKDWNDILKDLGNEDFTSFIMKSIRSI